MQEEKLAINVVFTFQVKAVSGMYVGIYTWAICARVFYIIYVCIYLHAPLVVYNNSVVSLINASQRPCH